MLFLIGQFIRAILRQKMIIKLLPENIEKIKPAMAADILGNCIWSWLLLVCIVASAFSRTIICRGIKYKLISPTETIVIGQE